MLKTNPKVDLEVDEYGELSFQYRSASHLAPLTLPILLLTLP